MGRFNRGPVVPVLRLSGRHRHGGAAAAGAFARRRSPGRSRTRSRCRRRSRWRWSSTRPAAAPCSRACCSAACASSRTKRSKKVYVFCEDVAASGGYYLAVAGDEIYADASSIVGSIGVISASFGLDRAIDKLGIERRVYTSGAHKGSLDPFQPEKPDDIERLKAIQRNVHDVFIGVVKDRRLGAAQGAGRGAVLGRVLVGGRRPWNSA